ncbi:MAG: uncharacterized protein A8A55_1887 [Amphiamblys sp. WSBS2006]|nr:MAG: uncharacterized protein A8A55_1887 [Amphiamblys sp. WSBS2006]
MEIVLTEKENFLLAENILFLKGEANVFLTPLETEFYSLRGERERLVFCTREADVFLSGETLLQGKRKAGERDSFFVKRQRKGSFKGEFTGEAKKLVRLSGIEACSDYVEIANGRVSVPVVIGKKTSVCLKNVKVSDRVFLLLFKRCVLLLEGEVSVFSAEANPGRQVTDTEFVEVGWDYADFVLVFSGEEIEREMKKLARGSITVSLKNISLWGYELGLFPVEEVGPAKMPGSWTADGSRGTPVSDYIENVLAKFVLSKENSMDSVELVESKQEQDMEVFCVKALSADVYESILREHCLKSKNKIFRRLFMLGDGGNMPDHARQGVFWEERVASRDEGSLFLGEVKEFCFIDKTISVLTKISRGKKKQIQKLVLRITTRESFEDIVDEWRAKRINLPDMNFCAAFTELHGYAVLLFPYILRNPSKQFFVQFNIENKDQREYIWEYAREMVKYKARQYLPGRSTFYGFSKELLNLFFENLGRGYYTESRESPTKRKKINCFSLESGEFSNIFLN